MIVHFLSNIKLFIIFKFYFYFSGGADDRGDLRDINKRPFPRWYSNYLYHVSRFCYYVNEKLGTIIINKTKNYNNL